MGKKVQRAGLLLLLLAVVGMASAANETVKLHTIVHTIKNLQGTIRETHDKKETVSQQLRKDEIAIGNYALALRATERKLTYEQALLNHLYRDKRSYQQQLLQQQQSLRGQMRAAYMLGQQPVIKLLLNKQDPNRFSRIFVYYNYLQQYRLQLIAKITFTLEKLRKNSIAIEKKTVTLKTLKVKQHREYSELAATKKRRAVVLQKIDSKLRTQKSRLHKLMADKRVLEELIAKLQQETTSRVFATPLAKLSKRLHWPTKGHVEDIYGEQIANSQLHWKGVIIDAPYGQDVYSIATGKVVFAQWLRGYGLLLIINHGHGYMSLYGRNSSLYRKPGDVVQAGDLIATVGNSGGYTHSGLYFAIRYDGQPVNPKLWCS